MKTLSMMAVYALSVSAFTFSAQAAEEGDTMRFPYAPHEISTVKGAAALLQRIEIYAQGQCLKRARNPESKACAADMVKQLVASIDSPHLHRAARGKGPTLAMLAE